MTITALPTPPSRADSPDDFSGKADALLGALPLFVTEANALQSDVNAKEASASSYATIATDKAAEAQASATTASTKASEAAASAVAAAAAASNAEIAFDSFDDKYLGSKASDPTTDNDGNALLVGALYWNTSVGAVRVWNGSAWLSMAADASIVDFQQAGAGAVVRTAQDKMREVVSVKDFGAVGDGVADDTAAVQLALNSGAKTVYFPPGTYRWGTSTNGPTIASNTTVIGHGAVIVQPNADTAATISVGTEYCGLRINVGTENVTIEGLEFRGPYYGITVSCEYRSIGINISGRYDQYFYNNANHPSNPSIAVSGANRNITIKDCTFDGWGQSGVIADQIINFQAYGNTILNCGRDGIRMYGCVGFNVHHNYIKNMAPGFDEEGISPNNNVYGITATRIYHSTLADGSLTDYPKSERGVISENVVEDCPSWKALDAHGGTDIVFRGNIVRNAHIGIGIDKGGFNLVDGYGPPRRITIEGNQVVADPANTSGNRCGIFCVAHDATNDNIGEDLIIVDNYVTGYGENARDGNIVVSNFRRGVISNNVVVGGLRSGINFQQRAEDFVVRGGVIANVARTTESFLTGVSVQGAEQRVSVDGVTFIKNDTADTMNAVSTVIPSAGYGVKMGDCNTFTGTVTPAANPAHFVVDSPYITRTVAFGNINNDGTSASIVAARGIAAVNRTGTGVVEVTLDETLAAAASVTPTVLAKGSNMLCFVNATAGNVITVSTRTATTNAGIDAGFYIQVHGY